MNSIPDPPAAAGHGCDRLFIRELTVMARIGVYAWERRILQPVVISVDIETTPRRSPEREAPDAVISYDDVARRIGGLIRRGHVRLVETLAENIAVMCLAYPQARAVRVRVEKPGAIRRARTAGVEIERRK